MSLSPPCFHQAATPLPLPHTDHHNRRRPAPLADLPRRAPSPRVGSCTRVAPAPPALVRPAWATRTAPRRRQHLPEQRYEGHVWGPRETSLSSVFLHARHENNKKKIVHKVESRLMTCAEDAIQHQASYISAHAPGSPTLCRGAPRHSTRASEPWVTNHSCQPLTSYP